jgi:hypothetical protein
MQHRADNEADTIRKITNIERVPKPQLGNAPLSLKIEAVTPIGTRTLLIGETAARDLAIRLLEFLGN